MRILFLLLLAADGAVFRRVYERFAGTPLTRLNANVTRFNTNVDKLLSREMNPFFRAKLVDLKISEKFPEYLPPDFTPFEKMSNLVLRHKHPSGVLLFLALVSKFDNAAEVKLFLKNSSLVLKKFPKDLELAYSVEQAACNWAQADMGLCSLHHLVVPVLLRAAADSAWLGVAGTVKKFLTELASPRIDYPEFPNFLNSRWSSFFSFSIS